MNTERPDNDDTSGTSGDVRGVGDAAGGKGAPEETAAEGRAAADEAVDEAPAPVEEPAGDTEAGEDEGEPTAAASAASAEAATSDDAAADDGDTAGAGDTGDTGGEVGDAGTSRAQEADTDTDTEEPEVDGVRPDKAGSAASAAGGEHPEETGPPSGPTPPGAGLPGPGRDHADHADEAHEAEDGHPARRRSPLVVASVAAAVLLVGGGGAYLASSASGGSGGSTGSAASGGDGTPPPLALDGYATGGTGGIASGEPNPYGETYRAEGTLPGGPGSAAVYWARGAVTKDAVARLAKALGVDGTPVAEGQVWKIGGQDGTGPSLQVNRAAPGTWTFNRYAPGTDNCTSTLKCTHDPASSGDEPVSVAVAEKAAAPVLKAVGQDDAKVDASQLMGAQRVVNAEPVVGGLPTHGWTTGLTVGAQGEVVGGSGQLAAPVKGDVYPVLSAQKTLALMNAAPKTDHRMGIGGCATPVPLKDRLEAPCGSSTSAAAPATPTPTQAAATVEHAVFGLAEHSVDAKQTLVPSWLFEVREPGAQDSFTVTYPAIDPKYLTSAGTPTPTSSSTSTPTTRDVKVDGYTADGKDLTVAYTGGVCGDYAASAAEGPDKVTVTVTETPWRGKVCIMIAKVYHQTVHLDAPLGDRKVVGSDGREIPVEKAATRLPESSPAAR